MMDDLKEVILELAEKVARIDERTEIMLKRMNSYNGQVAQCDRRITELERRVERHATYFKILGAAFSVLVMVLCAIITAFGGMLFK